MKNSKGASWSYFLKKKPNKQGGSIAQWIHTRLIKWSVAGRLFFTLDFRFIWLNILLARHWAVSLNEGSCVAADASWMIVSTLSLEVKITRILLLLSKVWVLFVIPCINLWPLGIFPIQVIPKLNLMFLMSHEKILKQTSKAPHVCYNLLES